VDLVAEVYALAFTGGDYEDGVVWVVCCMPYAEGCEGAGFS